jgi:hypothetical protein
MCHDFGEVTFSDGAADSAGAFHFSPFLLEFFLAAGLQG